MLFSLMTTKEKIRRKKLIKNLNLNFDIKRRHMTITKI